MKIFVGFVAYRQSSAPYLRDFLNSLFYSLSVLGPLEYEVCAFDNSGPEDSSNRLIIEEFNADHRNDGSASPGLVRYLAEGGNYGFGRAYNILIREALRLSAEYFLVINPDVYLSPESLSLLIKALDKQPLAAAAAPKILYWDFPGRRLTTIIDSLGIALRPGLRFIDAGQGQPDRGQSFEIIGPTGAAGLFRLSALSRLLIAEGRDDQLEFFDELFFMYKEDCDIAYRLFFNGHQTIFVPDALIYHDRTARAADSRLSYFRQRRQQSQQVRAWSFLGQHLIFIKHWKKQNIVNRFIISFQIASYFIFALIFEQFLLKQYLVIWRAFHPLTNIK